MPRRLFTVTSAVSLVLCVATMVLWVRSYAVADKVSWSWEDRQVAFCPSRGRLHLSWQWAYSPGGFHESVRRHYEENLPREYETETNWSGRQVRVAGFHFGTQMGISGAWYSAYLPMWFLTAVLAIGPVWRCCLWWRGVARKIELAEMLLAHRCSKCGYDLRATPDRCPECGTVPAAPRNG